MANFYRIGAQRKYGFTLIELIVTLVVISITVLAFGTSMRILLSMDGIGGAQDHLDRHSCAEAIIAKYDYDDDDEEEGEITRENCGDDACDIDQCDGTYNQVSCKASLIYLLPESDESDELPVCKFTIGGESRIVIHVPISDDEE
ncbi:hypothetical protein HH1059_06590 [Halorhodospira halochloris]|uniref:Uncharacterized protein n=1 Tax=Halorhodospira halochloris TaxID=1052 RepID=A0A0X8X8C9_HALHR|nr:type II secretion system protein [Halorhodospira halochloris]MBK1652867.1 hypothetical protein [Halorhodospira halochloris]BAU57346.1 hypothetical protein HH1059_06590 [Halorhodospira halochloris]